MSSKILLVLSLLATSLIGTGCAGDDAPDPELGEAAATTMEWFPLQEGCATSIAVAPNDVVWVTGCDGEDEHSVWYMRYEVSCFEGICGDFPVWHDNTGSGASSGRGNHVAINRAGGAMSISADGFRVMAALGRDGSDGIARPTGRWQNLFPWNQLCLNEVEEYPVSNEGALAFETPQRQIDQSAFRYLATDCYPDANGNSQIDRRIGQGQNSPWQAVFGRGAKLALFYRLFGETLSQTFWALAADGTIWLYDGDMHFQQMPAPPSYTYDLTDHFAAAEDGIYQWNDSAERWDRYIDNETIGGPVKQISHAGAVRVRRKDGTVVTIGPSTLWAIDHGGTIYFAAPFDQPR
jgi:hypothetical protein